MKEPLHEITGLKIDTFAQKRQIEKLNKELECQKSAASEIPVSNVNSVSSSKLQEQLSIAEKKVSARNHEIAELHERVKVLETNVDKCVNIGGPSSGTTNSPPTKSKIQSGAHKQKVATVTPSVCSSEIAKTHKSENGPDQF